MNVETLRSKHPSFVYESFNLREQSEQLTVEFLFRISPDITFHPVVHIPLSHHANPADVNNFAFHLGLIEAISYWKATCSPEIIVKAGTLTNEQVNWWHDLFLHGLGEFFYRNNIDFTIPNFLSIQSTATAPNYQAKLQNPTNGSLILVGGGKDSALTLDLLRQRTERKNVLMLNPRPAAETITETSGYKNPIIVRRAVDQKLLDLTAEGYLNGHTPFSAYLAFLGLFVGALQDYEYVIASNEQSASEGNVLFHSMEVNHQYSKSLRFENLFREYAEKYLANKTKYFSILRPLYELQIARLFSPLLEKYPSFISCNVNKGQSWCGECPKCAFIYLSLFPFINGEQLQKTFGKDFFSSVNIQKYIRDLVGLGEYKPFECVGTKDESVLAVALSIKKLESQNTVLPPFFAELKNKLHLTDTQTFAELEKRLRTDWSNMHFLPEEYVNILKQRLSQI